MTERRKAKDKANREDLDALILRLAADTSLDSWNSLVEELMVPSDLLPALMSNRPELLALAQPRAMTAEEVKVLYDLIAGLMKTNDALRTHATHLAQMVENWSQLMQGLQATGHKIRQFANFETIYSEG